MLRRRTDVKIDIQHMCVCCSVSFHNWHTWHVLHVNTKKIWEAAMFPRQIREIILEPLAIWERATLHKLRPAAVYCSLIFRDHATAFPGFLSEPLAISGSTEFARHGQTTTAATATTTLSRKTEMWEHKGSIFGIGKISRDAKLSRQHCSKFSELRIGAKRLTVRSRCQLFITSSQATKSSKGSRWKGEKTPRTEFVHVHKRTEALHKRGTHCAGNKTKFFIRNWRW